VNAATCADDDDSPVYLSVHQSAPTTRTADPHNPTNQTMKGTQMAASIIINLLLLTTLVTVTVCLVFDRHGWHDDTDDYGYPADYNGED